MAVKLSQHKSLILAAFLCVLALIVPVFVSGYFLLFAFMLLTYTVLAQSFNILNGLAGYVNLGCTVFFAVGAYTTIVLSYTQPLFLSILGGGIITAFFALAIGLPFFRLKGAFFMIGTYVMVPVALYIVQNVPGLTGGVTGKYLYVPSGVTMPLALPYYLGLVLALSGLFLAYKLPTTKLGLALRCIREDETTAAVFGVNSQKSKLEAIMLSGLFSGLMGSIFALFYGFISPDLVLGTQATFAPLAMAILGGSGVFIGPIFGVAVLYSLEQWLYGITTYFHLFLYGVALLATGLLLPTGILTKDRINQIKLKASQLLARLKTE